MDSLELSVTSCLHLIRAHKGTDKLDAFGSGVIVQYKNRYFICTAAHFTDYTDMSIGIVTGRVKGDHADICFLGNFQYIDEIAFEELPDDEDFEFIVNNPEKSGKRLDIAVMEIPLIGGLYQGKKIFNLTNGKTLTVPEGSKSYLIVDDSSEIDQSQLCSFYGRIRPADQGHIIDFQEYLYHGLSIVSLSRHLIQMDLGAPITDPTRFRGCSGAPVIDTRGKLVGILTNGPDIKKPVICAFRFDKVKQWIDFTYFNQIPENRQPS